MAQKDLDEAPQIANTIDSRYERAVALGRIAPVAAKAFLVDLPNANGFVVETGGPACAGACRELGVPRGPTGGSGLLLRASCG